MKLLNRNSLLTRESSPPKRLTRGSLGNKQDSGGPVIPIRVVRLMDQAVCLGKGHGNEFQSFNKPNIQT